MDISRLRLSPRGTAPSKVDYLHGSSYSKVCAFSYGEKIEIRIRIPRTLGATHLSLFLFDESGERIGDHDAHWSASAGKYDYYIVRLPKDTAVGLYFYRLCLNCASGLLFAYPDKSGISFSYGDGHDFQLSVSKFAYPTLKDGYGGVIYHIFVDRFARSGKTTTKPDTILVEDWSNGIPEYPEYPGAPLKNNTFYGGTLRGITKKLPYIASLGTTLIYLSPIFEAASNHKYDTADYMHVDKAFGGESALKELISKAGKYGIKIILDGVFNHTGDDSIYFNRYGKYSELGAYQSETSRYYPWYSFEEHPDKYTSWWGIEILPRINPDNPECRNFFTGNGGVISKYARMGIGGLRLDVVDELSDDFVREIKSVMHSNNPSTLLYGEVWEDASNKIAYGKRKKYYLGDELDGVMNYPLRKGLISYILYKDTDSIRYALENIISNAPTRIANMQMNLLGTHDTERILTVLGGEPAEGKSNDYLATKRMSAEERSVAVSRLKMAYTIISTLPGLPMIFYGDEVGLEGYSDPFNRLPYPWGNENTELLEHYRRLGKIRQAHKVYGEGDFELLHLSDELLIFKRTLGAHVYVTVANNGCTALSLMCTSADARPLLGSMSAVPQYGATIIKTKKNDTLCINQL